jgi:hypothetical protein
MSVVGEAVAVAGAVPAIVQAFNSCINAYEKHKSRRRRRTTDQDDELELSLDKGSRKVQTKYDEGFASLGERFAVGDSKLPYFVYCTAQGSEEQVANFTPGRGREELYLYIIQLQQTINLLMVETSGSSNVTLPKLPKILSTSENTRKGVVSTLDEQYQRLAQSRTLRTVFSAIFNRKSTREMAALGRQLPRELEKLGSTARQPGRHQKVIQWQDKESDERVHHRIGSHQQDKHGCMDIWPLTKLFGCTRCEDCNRDCNHYRFRCEGCLKGLCKCHISVHFPEKL